MCHSGLLGLFRAIYTGTGGKCELNHATNLKETLRLLIRGMLISQSFVSGDNGKVVCLLKVAEQMNSKMDVLTKLFDVTFSHWHKQLNKFSNSVQYHESMTMEFLSKYSTVVNIALTAFKDFLKYKTF